MYSVSPCVVAQLEYLNLLAYMQPVIMLYIDSYNHSVAMYLNAIIFVFEKLIMGGDRED